MTIYLEHAIVSIVKDIFSTTAQVPSTIKSDTTGPAVYTLLLGIQHGVLVSHLLVQFGRGFSLNRPKRQK